MLRPHAEVEAPAPDDLILLHAFADLHAISRNEANQRWRAGFIAGVKQGTGKRPMITIGAKGRRDFWVQFHNTSGFRACDQCPHSTV